MHPRPRFFINLRPFTMCRPEWCINRPKWFTSLRSWSTGMGDGGTASTASTTAIIVDIMARAGGVSVTNTVTGIDPKIDFAERPRSDRGRLF